MLPKNVNINEVGPRDGLQNETINISIEEKVKFINLFYIVGDQEYFGLVIVFTTDLLKLKVGGIY